MPTAVGAFTICPSPPRTATCPLPLASFIAPVHDAFGLSIAEIGWQEERASSADFETRIVLSRADDPRQRLTFLSGETGPATPAILDPAAFSIPGFKAGQPMPTGIAGTDGRYIDLEPAGAKTASSVTIETQTIPVKPDRRYRFTVARIPMGDEAATVIMVTEAPVSAFPRFVAIADRVLQSVKF
jgi:hypothetical protein